MTDAYARSSPGILCVLYLEHAAHEAEQAARDLQRWFLALPLMHLALGAILVPALAGSASMGAYIEEHQREWEAYFDALDDEDHPFPDADHMQPVSALLRRVQKKKEPEMQGRPVVLTQQQKKDLGRFTYYRNQLEHVRPGSWSLEVAGLPRVLAAVAEVIHQLLQERRCCTDLEEQDEVRAEHAITQIRTMAAGRSHQGDADAGA
ncbi:hypothetical protein MKK69_14230 [Methylobacterium sp. J-026]|uniref:hypothetical protein n=1 Tax=Methylobacterium sp. J-026 TaxID=2836624 RepID=UPI001FBB4C94|nr:hypothetical protein [Methylobacterium sp. J-026]MCJ2135195.1 hypothetical protein [Methylobacterium sp. J-026]